MKSISGRCMCALLWTVLFHTALVLSSYRQILRKYDVQPLSDQAEVDGPAVSEPSSFLGCLYPSDCAEVRSCERTKSGVYRVFPFRTGKGFLVFCDMVSNGGGWLVIQRRQDGSVDFSRNWQDYTDGFGNLYGEYWLGLEKIHLLTSQADFELLVNMRSYDNGTGYASYNLFRVSDESENFRLLLGKFKGNVGDSLSYHNGFEFSTLDRENDFHDKKNCAAVYRGAWWYKSCHYSNLNGQYFHVNRKSEKSSSSATWWHWASAYVPLQFIEMKIRPVGSN